MNTRSLFLIFVVIGFVCSNASATIPTAVYNFDEGSGSIAVDSSGNGYNGTIGNGTWVTHGSGYAIRLTDVAGSNITIPDNEAFDFTSQNITIVIELNLTADWEGGGALPNNIISKTNSHASDYGWSFFRSQYTDAASIRMKNGTDYDDGAVSTVADEWDVGYWEKHVFRWNATSKEFAYFKNGYKMGTQTVATAGTYPAESTADVIIGRGVTSMYGIDGEVDTIEIYNEFVDDEECIGLSYAEVIGGPVIPPTSTWYISASGDNGNSGEDDENPFATVEYACSVAESGDTFMIDGGAGIYYGDDFNYYWNAIEGITAIGYNGTPQFDFMGNPRVGSFVYMNNLSFTNLEFYNASTGPKTSHSGNITFDFMNIHDMTVDGFDIDIDSYNVSISNSIVSDVGNHGILLYNQYSPSISGNHMIINTSVSNAPHNLIDIHTNQSNIVIDGCELFYTDEYTGAKQVSIYLHNANTDNIIINDTYIHDAYRNIEIYNSDNVTITNSVIENSTASGIHLIGSTSSQELDNWGITNLTVASNTFKNISHPYTFSQDNNNMMNLDLLNNTYENNTLESDYENAVTPIYQATMVGTYPVILSSVDTLFDVGDIIDSELVAMPAVEYFYGNTDYSYLDYPEVLEWNSTLGIFTKRFLLDGTILEEDAPERVTGVEVMP